MMSRKKQRGFLLNPARFGGGGGGGSDPYFSNVTCLMHFDGGDGSTTFTDKTGRSFTVSGGPTISTAQSKFGGSSGLFSGTHNLYAAHDTGLNLDADFTIECWVRLSSYSSSYAGSYGAAIASEYSASGSGTNNGWQVRIDGTSSSYDAINVYSGNTTITFSASFSLNTWHFIAVSRVSGQIRAFVDGTQVGSTVSNSEAFSQNGGGIRPLYIGRLNDATYQFYLQGNLDDFRITKGIGRYTADFTPPTSAFPDA